MFEITDHQHNAQDNHSENQQSINRRLREKNQSHKCAESRRKQQKIINNLECSGDFLRIRFFP